MAGDHGVYKVEASEQADVRFRTNNLLRAEALIEASAILKYTPGVTEVYFTDEDGTDAGIFLKDGFTAFGTQEQVIAAFFAVTAKRN
jgi:hypothetical protein